MSSRYIDKIRPEVAAAGYEPFIIYRDDEGGWHSDFTQNQYGETFDWVEDVINDDLLSFVARGKDFKSALKQDLYNDILCRRLENECHNIGTFSTNAEHKKIRALLNFFEDNIAEFSQEVLNYLAEMGSPLIELSLMCPYNLAVSNNGRSFNTDLAPVAVHTIERTIKELIKELDEADIYKQARREVDAMLECGEIPGEQKRVIDGHYIEKFSIALAGREVFLAADEKEDAPYLVCTSRRDNPLGVTEYFDGEVTTDYIEALREFVDRVDILLDVLEKERAAFPTLQPMLTAADCVPGGLDESLQDKLVVIKPEVLSPEYRTADHQLKIVQGGFGANPNSRGNAVFCKDLYSDKETRFERYDIAGVIDPAKLPNWAKDKIDFLEALKEPGVFASGESEVDIFKCVENGKLYVPCENELFRYTEPPVRIKKLQTKLLGQLDNNLAKVEKAKAEQKDKPISKKRIATEVE
jgi:hypothetical protein